MKIGLGENLGDVRSHRDPTADSALARRLADPEKAAADDAAARAANAANEAAMDPREATAARIAALAATFGDWAVVADVLQQEDKIDGEELAAAVAGERQRYPTAAAWMRANF